ncbi:MAG: endonuclease/exonuclease/phosphatase family protein [Cyclobacteriaceae bacterium]|nr:endonuclease/exonuclease/phosphatase family protein [Cyclobacteriaceae bacterium]
MRYFAWLLFFVSLLIFGSVYVRPGDFQYVGLIPFFIPLIWLANLFLFLILALSWKKSALIPLFALAIGYRFAEITVQWNLTDESEQGLSVLSYNVHLFDYKRRIGGEFDPNIFSWIQEHPAQIKVFQEFYQDYTSPSRNAVNLLGKENDKEIYYEIIEGRPDRRSYGLAISSALPIVNQGKVFDNKKTNGAIFADVLYQKDTIRIYNCHLESMKINSENLDDLEGVRANYRQTLKKLHQGSLYRSQQLDVLEQHIINSPHPIILMGDLNEIPYSNSYFRLSRNLNNAFEDAGKGFGFTYNRVLFFLRIDHIFSSPNLKATQFDTHREVDYSDHYPVSATFQLID